MTDELLKVLDMTARQQAEWVCFYTDIHTGESLADLAFRMRDEVDVVNLHDALVKVHDYCDRGADRMYVNNYNGAINWFIHLAPPIHWIIAALLAKEME